jgi:uncharacterized membrane protein
LKNSRFSDEHSALETAISYVLIIGVVTSLLLGVVGMAVFYRFHGHMNISHKREMFVHGQNFFDFLYGLTRGYQAKEGGMFLMILGIAVLIITPYIRVILSVLYFLWKRDMKYVLITVFVFLVLTASLYLH